MVHSNKSGRLDMGRNRGQLGRDGYALGSCAGYISRGKERIEKFQWSSMQLIIDACTFLLFFYSGRHGDMDGNPSRSTTFG